MPAARIDIVDHRPVALSGAPRPGNVMMARNELLARLKHAASHDPLTHVLNRGGFLAAAQAMLAVP